MSLAFRYAFSKNGYPTMIPIPNNNAELGKSTQMSQNDITRLNRLYQCCESHIYLYFHGLKKDMDMCIHLFILVV